MKKSQGGTTGRGSYQMKAPWTRKKEDSSPIACPECNGVGSIEKKTSIKRGLLPDYTKTEVAQCKNCGGTGRISA